MVTIGNHALHSFKMYQWMVWVLNQQPTQFLATKPVHLADRNRPLKPQNTSPQPQKAIDLRPESLYCFRTKTCGGPFSVNALAWELDRAFSSNSFYRL
jgi:hypothetical protein